MTFSARRSTLVLAGLVMANFFGAASAAEHKANIVESHKIWNSDHVVSSTDLARFRDQWICVLQTAAGLQMIGSKDGGTWRLLSTVASSDRRFPLRDPRLKVTNRGRLMLTAVAPKAPLGGYSKTWLSRDAVEWKETPKPSAMPNYLVSSVCWHEGVAYNFQCGSICGSMQTIRIGASDNGKRFENRFEETFSGFFPGDGALVFSQNRGFCVMSVSGKQTSGAIGFSKTPFDSWQWKKLPSGLKHPNAIRATSGMILVAAGRRDDQGKLQTTLYQLAPDALQLLPLGEIPTGRSCFVGLANHNDQVFVMYPSRTGEGSTVHLARISIENR